eukprot:3827066-Rhodomonas_salina.1
MHCWCSIPCTVGVAFHALLVLSLLFHCVSWVRVSSKLRESPKQHLCTLLRSIDAYLQRISIYAHMQLTSIYACISNTREALRQLPPGLSRTIEHAVRDTIPDTEAGSVTYMRLRVPESLVGVLPTCTC